MSSPFPIDNGLKQGDSLRPVLFNFNLECISKTVQETNLGLYMNGTHEVLVYAGKLNLIGNGIRTMEKKNTDMLLNACKDIVLAVVKQSTWK